VIDFTLFIPTLGRSNFPASTMNIKTNNSIQRITQNYSEFLNIARESSRDVYIFGADIAGKAVQKILEKEGVNVAGFLDNNKNKCNTEVNRVFVYDNSKLSDLPQNSIFLIASTYIADIIEQLESQGFYDWLPIAFIIEANKGRDFRGLIDGALQQNHSGGEFTKDFVDFAISNMVNSQNKYLDPSLLFIRSVDLVLTEKCTLKCRDCCNLMQYYESPVNIEKQELFDDLDDVVAVSDEINEIRIIGGEPLVNKDFHEISRRATRYDKINKVVIYTNGTICPPDDKLRVLQDEKIFVFITTYGDLSKNGEKLRDRLEHLGIQHNYQPAYGWTECGGIETWGRSPQGNREIFKNCCAKHFTTMTDGKVFRCPFSANAERLSAIPQADEDFALIRGARVADSNKLREMKTKLRWFLRDKSCLSACDSCAGRTYGDPEIKPGLQVKQPIKHRRYARTLNS
jgi:sulfatase maturation enzyme AslB (radical SAM superfamily)